MACVELERESVGPATVFVLRMVAVFITGVVHSGDRRQDAGPPTSNPWMAVHMRRFLSALVVMTLIGFGGATAADAHIPDHFDLCVARGPNGPTCAAQVHVAAGTTVQLRGRISGHGGRVTVERFHRSGWDSVQSVAIDQSSRVRYSFRVPAGGLQNIFRFRLTKAGHGESPSIRIYRDR